MLVSCVRVFVCRVTRMSRVVLDVRRVQCAEPDTGRGAASPRLPHARRTHAGEESPVGGAHLAHAYAVDDGVGEEVERGQEVNQVELGVEQRVGDVLDVEVHGEEVEDHEGQPEEDESEPQHERRHERLVVVFGRRRLTRGGDETDPAAVSARVGRRRRAAAGGRRRRGRHAATVAEHLAVDAAVQRDDDDDETGERVRADFQRLDADGGRVAGAPLEAAAGRGEDEDGRQEGAHDRQHPGRADTRRRPALRRRRRRQQRPADGEVLVDGEHEEAEETRAEGEDDGSDEDDCDEETVGRGSDGEVREETGGVVVHPQEQGAERVGHGEVQQQCVVHGATADATQGGDGEGVEDEPGRRQHCERHEAKGVRTRTAASRAPVETGTGSS